MASTRERLVEAASTLLEEGGPAAVTLREVGRRADVSHNAPYKHFASKEELLAAVAAAHLRSGQQEMLRVRRSRRPVESVRLILHGMVRDALAHPEMFRLAYGPWTIDSAELGEAASAAMGSLVGLVAAGQADGDLPAGDPERVAAMLRALAHGAVDLALAGHLSRTGKGHASPDDLIDDLFALLPGASSFRS
jgi:AcrR family transcriptional regulator